MSRFDDVDQLPPRYQKQVRDQIATEALEARVKLRQEQSENENTFQRLVNKEAEVAGWFFYHTHDSRRSNSGFPDLVLVRPQDEAQTKQIISAGFNNYTGSFDDFLRRLVHHMSRDPDAHAPMMVRELKMDGAYPTPDQRRWLTMFALAGIDAKVWRPSDWYSILVELR